MKEGAAMKRRAIYFIELTAGIFYTSERKPTGQILRQMREGFANPAMCGGDIPIAMLKGRNLAIRHLRNEIKLLTAAEVQSQLTDATERYPAEAFYLIGG